MAVNETLDESMDLTLDLDEEEQVGVLNDSTDKDFEDAEGDTSEKK